jgi:hypothetical protein
MKNTANSMRTFLISIPVYFGLAVLSVLAPFMFFLLLTVWTGEILRYLLAVGHHKPAMSLDSIKSFSVFYFFTETSLYLGMVFWLSVMILLRYAFGCE